MSGRNSDGTGVLERVMLILEAFDRAPGAQTLTELCTATGLRKATMHRLLTGLVNSGLLARTADNRYALGIRLWEIAQNAGRQLRDAARPFLQDMFSLVGETTHLAVRESDEVLYIERIYGTRRVPRASRVGGRLPMHATAVGKAILAFEEEWVREAYLDREHMEQATARTIIDPKALRRELDEARTRGYATTREEVRVGSCSIAVPVFQSSQVVAAVGVVVNPEQADTMERFVPALQGTSRRIAKVTAHFPWETLYQSGQPSLHR
ncbi:IclR family transcriptional regulator [Microbacterium sp. CH12i]|uniref:IclR family transcriptional regulator n=1 Tax=Microbacterium sp. CH12i TaxID=1479651 RepID=UPI000461B952|nr:IclR family transcriptional regulator [Microbacterium sp. CH12i]KDA06491.1 IclR family transcriptional regulator [Microbacterium sp. CH12i]